ncbi:MAG: hypothetical protein PHP69_04590 [Candidatus Omnitrophica bacterium]|nr:hypothetical protein [Candidatus Omnitrophota bacterium]MDD5081634.1 hypothetical protein [Candidatus Omnitrophota bacterium]MDD5441323.1 hypothetical protein [Candidatus Omnitrophota bacterium]
MIKKRKAQSILEYIIVLSAIVVAVIAASENIIKPAVQDMFQDSADVITDNTDTFVNNVASNAAE